MSQILNQDQDQDLDLLLDLKINIGLAHDFSPFTIASVSRKAPTQYNDFQYSPLYMDSAKHPTCNNSIKASTTRLSPSRLHPAAP